LWLIRPELGGGVVLVAEVVVAWEALSAKDTLQVQYRIAREMLRLQDLTAHRGRQSRLKPRDLKMGTMMTKESNQSREHATSAGNRK